MRRLSAIAVLMIATNLAFPSSATPNLEKFAECLTDRGAVFYGAHWCPYCAEQKRMFGNTVSRLDYFECYEHGSRDDKSPDCAQIRGYPTWQTSDGRLHRGLKTLAQLSHLTGCPLE